MKQHGDWRGSKTSWWVIVALGFLTLMLISGCQQKVGWTPPPPPPPSQPPPPPPKAEYQVFYVAADRLNLRACPGMDCPKIAALTRNQEVEKVGESQGWFQVRSRQDGTLGWVDSRYLASAPVPAAVSLPASETAPPRTAQPTESKTDAKVEAKPKPKPPAETEEEGEETPSPRRRRVPEAEAAEPPKKPEAAPATETPAAPPPAPSEPAKKKIRIM